MVKIEVGFAPEGFEKAMVQQTKEDVTAKLQGHELGRVKIVFKKRPGHQLAFQFLGDPVTQFGLTELAAIELQPRKNVVERRFVHLDAGQAVGRCPRARRVGRQLIFASESQSDRHTILARLQSGHGRFQVQTT